MFLNVLAQAALGGNLGEIIQTGGTLTVLGFFVWYFMKEQKDSRDKLDAQVAKNEADIKEIRKVSDEKIDALNRRFEELNVKSINSLEEVKSIIEKNTLAIQALIVKIEKS